MLSQSAIHELFEAANRTASSEIHQTFELRRAPAGAAVLRLQCIERVSWPMVPIGFRVGM